MADYVAHSYLVDGVASGTIKNRLSGIRWHHLHDVGVTLAEHRLCAATQYSVAKLCSPPKPREGLFLPIIMAGHGAAAAAGGDALAVWRGIALAFYLLLRASEFWAYDSDGLVHPDFCVRVGDILFRRRGQPIAAAACRGADEARVIIRGSKTDQLRVGSLAVLVTAGGGAADPVRILADTVAALPAAATPAHPLMTVAAAGGGLRVLKRREAEQAIRALVVRQGLDPKRYGTHSMRVGGATTLAHAGVPARLIRAAGRWRSNAFEDYIRHNLADYSRICQALAGSGPERVAAV